MIAAVWLSSGLVLGLAASLHCAGMCGAIGSSFLFTVQPGGAAAQRLSTLLVAQAGRITSYAIAGAVVGSTGAAFLDVLDRGEAFRGLQMASALTLVWIGLSVAGLLPSLVGLDQLLAPLSRSLLRLRGSFARGGMVPPFASGLLWGMIPCGMVYAALFTALLTGHWEGGVVLMTGFGLGTLPAVTLSAMGTSTLRGLATRSTLRPAIGVVIAVVGILPFFIPIPEGPLCVAPRAAVAASTSAVRSLPTLSQHDEVSSAGSSQTRGETDV